MTRCHPRAYVAGVTRRRLLVTVLAALGATPVAGVAQPRGKLRRIGYLDQGSAARNAVYLAAFRQGLRDFGWVEGQTIAIDVRFAEGKTADLPALAAELVRLKSDVIVTWSTPAAFAAKRATKTIPIVIGFAADPVKSGIIESIRHPEANITGWTHLGLELRAKYLELLKEAVPHAVRFGVLWNPLNQVHKPSLAVIEAAAQRLKVDLHLTGVEDAKDLEQAYAMLAAKRVEALVVFPDGMFVAQTPLLLRLAARNALPAMYGVREYAEAGGLMSYGANLADMQRRVGASFVDRILRGAKPADLPLAQPTVYELIINLRTAKSLGLAIPQALLLRADQIID